MTNEPPEQPKTLKELLWKIKFHEDDIFVRHNSKTLPLSNLNPEAWANEVSNWLKGWEDGQ